MPMPKIPADLFDALGLIAAVLAFLLLIAISPAIAFAAGCLVFGIELERRLDAHHRVAYWWDRQRSRFGA